MTLSETSSFVELPGLPDHLFSIYVEPEDELVLMAVVFTFLLIIIKSFIPILSPTGRIGVQRTYVVKNLAGET